VLLALSLNVNKNESDTYLAYAIDTQSSLPDFVTNNADDIIYLPGREDLPNRNQYVLMVELKADMRQSIGVATRQYVRFLYSDNGGASFTIIQPRINTNISTEDIYDDGTTDSDGWFIYGMVATAGQACDADNKYIENVEVNKILWGILINQQYNSQAYPFYTQNGAPTISLMGTYSVYNTSRLDLVFLPSKDYFLTGHVALLNNYSTKSLTQKESLSTFGFNNEGYYRNNGDTYDENDSSNPINTTTSCLSGYPSADQSTGLDSYSVFSDLNIGVGSDYVSDKLDDYYFEVSSVPVKGLSSSGIYKNSSLFVIGGAANFYFFGGKIDGGNIGKTFDGDTNTHATILATGPQNSSAKTTIVVQDSAIILNYHKASNILIDGISSNVILHRGGTIGRIDTETAISSINNSVAIELNLYLLGGKVYNQGGTLINWGDSASTGNLILVDSHIFSDNTNADSKVSIIKNSSIEFIMIGGIIENLTPDGIALENSESGDLKITGGQIITNSTSTASVLNSYTGTLIIEKDVTITNHAQFGIAIQNSSNGTINLSLDAKISGALDLNADGSYIYSADIQDGTENLDCLYTDISDLKIGDSYSFISNNSSYELSDVNNNLYALALISYIQYTDDPDGTDSISDIAGNYKIVTVRAVNGLYPNEQATANPNKYSDDTFMTYTGFSVKYYIYGTDIEVKPGTPLLEGYKTPHLLRSELILNAPSVNLTNTTIDTVFAKDTTQSFSISYSHVLSDAVNYSTNWSVDKSKTDFFYVPLSLDNLVSSLSVSDVSDSGYYKHTLDGSVTKFGLTHSFRTIESFWDVTIDYQIVSVDNVLLRFSGTEDEYTKELSNVITQGSSFLADTKIILSDYSELALNTDYTVTYRNNTFASNDGSNAIADVIITLSDNYLFELGDGEFAHIIIKTFEIIPKIVESIFVTYIDDFARDEYRRAYDAYDSLSLDGIALVARYNDNSTTQIFRDHYEIQYQRYSDDSKTSLIFVANTDCFYAVTGNIKVLFVYENITTYFGGEFNIGSDTNSYFTVSKLDTGVSVEIPDGALYSNDILLNYTKNPYAVKGEWHFEPPLFIDTTTEYNWTFTPEDTINYSVATGTVVTTPSFAEALSITIDRDGLYLFTAFQTINPESFVVWLNYLDSSIPSSNVSQLSQILYYHGSQTGVNDILNEVKSWSETAINAALSDTFLASDIAFVVRYVPFDSMFNDYAEPLYAVFKLDAPVTKISLSVNPVLPSSIYTSTPFESFSNTDVQNYGTMQWTLTTETNYLTTPLVGYRQYTYCFVPNDALNYEIITAEIWIETIQLELQELLISVPNLEFAAMSSIPTLSELFDKGLLVSVIYNDPSKNVSFSSTDANFSLFYPRNYAHDLIGSDDCLILSYTDDYSTISDYIPITVKKLQFEASLSELLPENNSTVQYSPNTSYTVQAISSLIITQSLYREVSLTDYDLATSDKLVRGILNEKKYYVKMPSNIIQDVGSYNLIIVVSADEDYYEPHDDLQYSITITIASVNTIVPILLMPTQSPVDQSTWNYDYWFKGELPVITVSKDNTDKTIIESGVFLWYYNNTPVSSLIFSGDYESSATYTWVWNKPNYVSQSGTVTLNIHTNDIISIEVAWKNPDHPKTYSPLDLVNITSDDIIVKGTYKDGITRTLYDSQIVIIYDNGAPSSSDEFRLYGDHTKVTFALLEDLSIKTSLNITVNKNNYLPSSFDEVRLTLKQGISYTASAIITDSNLSAVYYIWSSSLSENAPVGNYLTVNSSSTITDLTSEFYGYYVPLTSFSAAHIYKVLAHFIPNPDTARNYNEPLDMVTKYYVLYEPTISKSDVFFEGFIYDYSNSDTNSQKLALYLSASYNGNPVPGTFSFARPVFDVASEPYFDYDLYLNPISYDVIFTPTDTDVYSLVHITIDISINPLDSDYPTHEITTFLDWGEYNEQVIALEKYAGDSVKDYLKKLFSDSSLTDVIKSFALNFLTAPFLPASSPDKLPKDSSLDFGDVLDSDLFVLQTLFFTIPDFESDDKINTIYFKYNYHGFWLNGQFDIYNVLTRNLADYVTVPDSQSKDYDGTPFSLFFDGLQEGDVVTYKTTGEYTSSLTALFSDMTSVGTYTFTINITRENYVLLNKTITFEIYSNITFDISSATLAAFSNDASIWTTKAPLDGSTGFSELPFTITLPEYYIPLGWYYVEGTRQILLFSYDGTLLDDNTWTDRPSFTVYLKWKYVQYTITFDIGISDTYTGSKPSVSMPFNSYLTLNNEAGSWNSASIAGKSIVGWISSSGEHYALDAFTNTYALLITDNETLTAIWASISYKLEFVLDSSHSMFIQVGFNQDTMVYAPSLATILKSLSALDYSTPTIQNNFLLGWSPDSGFFDITTFDFTTAIPTNPKNASGDTIIRFYPVWKPKTIYITFDKNYNGATIDAKTMSHVYGDNESIIQKFIYQREGYTLQGWSDTPQGSIVFYALDVPDYAGAYATEDKSVVGQINLTLYAQWIPISYSIIYFPGFTGPDSVYDSRLFYYDVEYLLDQVPFSREGYTFTGWSDSTTSYVKGSTISNLAAQNDATVFLTAQWISNAYNILYDPNGGTLPSSDAKMEAEALSYDTPHTLLKNLFIREGFYFVGWTTDVSLDKIFDDEATVLNLSDSGDVTLYALWDTITYSISWVVPEGAIGYMGQTTYSIEEKLPNNPYILNGYTFLEYSVKVGDITYSYPVGTPFKTILEETNLDEVYTQTVDISISVVFKPISYSVKYITGDPDNQPVFAIEYNTHVSLKTAFDLVLTKTGYSFDYWSLSSDLDATKLDDIYNLTSKEQIINIYAHWKPFTFTVAFDSDGGSLVASVEFTYDVFSLLPAPSKDDFVFSGWLDSENNHYSTGYYKNIVSDPLENGTSSITLKAQWVAIGEPGVQYIGNGGSGQMPKTSGTANSTVKLTANTFIRAGYDFIGWSTSSDATVASYQDNSDITLTTNLITVFAVWQASTYTLTINDNGGTLQINNPSTLIFDQAYSLNAPSKTGYIFNGYLIQDTNDSFPLTGIYTTTANLVLNASFSPIEYTVVFNPNGGIGSITPQTFFYDELKEISRNTQLIQRKGYTFQFWLLNQTPIYDGSLVSNLASVDYAVVVLNAYWKPNKYIVIFNSNNDENLTVTQQFDYDSESTLIANTFTKTGYLFERWTLTSTGTGLWYDDCYSVSNLVSQNGGSINLYANWRPITYFVEYDSNGGTGSMKVDKFTYNESKALTEARFLKEGHAFIGWALSNISDSVDYQDSAIILNLSYINDATITLYAIYQPGSYVVKYDKNDALASGIMTNSIHEYGVFEPLNNPTFEKTGFSLIGWSLLPGEANSVDFVIDYSKSQLTAKSEITLYAVWRINSYSLAFNTNGGTFVPSVFAVYGSPISLPEGDDLPLKAGFVFEGWFSDQSLTTPFSLTTMPAQNTTVFAGWSDSSIYYVLSFDTDGGSHIDAREGTYGTPIIDVSIPTKEGYVFTGWYLHEYDTSEYILTTMPAQDILLTARWKPAICEISFVTYGGGNVPKVVEHYGAVLELPALSKPGYLFEGWYTDTGLTSEFTSTTVPADIDVLYAKWSKKTITILFSTSGGTPVDPLEITVGDPIPNRISEREGFLFAGWYLNKELTMPLNYDLAPDTDLVLYASWVETSNLSFVFPIWAIILIILAILIIIAAVIYVLLSRKKREDLWKN
jgi:uncharacterized repeat protein (TIGR02543 family)